MAVSIVFEGPDKAGKTTNARILTYLLREAAGLKVLITREPGGTEIGDLFREYLKSDLAKSAHPVTNMLVFSAGRNELLQAEILPFKRENPDGVTIGDRDWWSSLTYQVFEGSDFEYTRMVQSPFMIYPDYRFFIDIPAEETYFRQQMEPFSAVDWRDRYSIEDLKKIRSEYLKLIRLEGGKSVVLIDGFEDPWEKIKQIYESTLLFMGMDKNRTEEGKRQIESAYLSFKKYGIEMHKPEIMNMRLTQLYEIIEDREGERARLGVESRRVLRLRMQDEWVKTGLVNNTRSREFDR